MGSSSRCGSSWTPPGVVFLVNAESVEAAKTQVHGLPMGQAGLMDFDVIPVGPLAPLGILIAEKQA